MAMPTRKTDLDDPPSKNLSADLEALVEAFPIFINFVGLQFLTRHSRLSQVKSTFISADDEILANDIAR